MTQSYRTRIAAASMLFLAAACGDAEQEAAAPEGTAVERGGTAVIADIADINTPVAIFAVGGLDGNIASDVLSMELLRPDWHEGRLRHLTAEQHPLALARRYEYLDADSTAIRFHMRSDARWSDGQPVTAHDVAYTYRLLADPAVASPHQGYTANIDSVTAQSDTTVTFYYGRRYPDQLTHATMAPLPRHVFEGTAPADLKAHPALRDPSNGALPTSGPFMIGPWQKGQSVTLVPNPHSPVQPNLERVVFRVVPDPTTRVVELQTQGVDFVQNVPSDQLARLRAEAAHLGFEAEERRFYDYIAYNPQAHPAFADPEVRRALGLALNVPQMLDAVGLSEHAEPAAGPYSPIFAEVYDPQRTPALGHDPERARQMLESRGWRDADGDGVREKDGRPLRFTLVTNAGNQRRADIAQIAQQQWRQIGADVQLQTLEFNTFMQQAIGQRQFEAALAGWQVALTPEALHTFWTPGTFFNLASYDDPETTRLMEQAQAQPTAALAAPLWKQAAGRIADAQPVTFLYYMDGVDAVNQRLRGVEIDTYGPYQNVHEWWIPAAQRRAGDAPAADTTAR